MPETPDGAALIRPTAAMSSAVLNGKAAYLNDKRDAVQALSDLLEKHRNLIKHGRIGLVAHHFGDVFQLVDLRHHLLQALVVIDQ